MPEQDQTTSKGIPLDDPRVQAIIQSFKRAGELLGPEESLTVKRLENIRKEHPELEIPATNTIYKVMRWPEAISLSGLDQGARALGYNEEHEAYYADMRYVANVLGIERLSTPVYDAFRRRNLHLGLKSSSAIRKPHKWEVACERAGLVSPQRALSRKATRDEMISSGRIVWRRLRRNMSPDTYRQFCGEQTLEMPTVEDILTEFRSWENFCREAKIEVADDVDPVYMWTFEEVERALRWARREFPDQFHGEDDYRRLQQDYPLRLPAWETVVEILEL